MATQDIAEKDKTEEQLEKILFGENGGFLNELQQDNPDSHSNGETEAEADLDGISDENLFFVDSHGDAGPKIGESRSADREKEKGAVWVDSDDERLHVSLASHTRLRKLRDFDGEDVVNGKEYIRRLRRQYERLHPTPAWMTTAMNDNTSRFKRRSSDSDIDMSDESSDDELPSQKAPTHALSELLRSAGSLISLPDQHSTRDRRKLRSGVIDIQRSKDIISKGSSSVDCLQFHSEYPIILSSGPSSTLLIHHISPHPPNPNPLLTSLHIRDNPLHSTAFQPCPTSQATTIYLSSRRRYIHTWSLTDGTITKIARPFTSTPHLRLTQRSTETLRPSPCGRYIGLLGSGRKGGGFINIFSGTTFQWICSARIESRGGVADFAWWRDGNGITVAGKNGEVSEYDVNERAAVGRWIDEGAVGTTEISLGGRSGDQRLGGDRYVAVGSSSGIVNIYDREPWAKLSATSDESEKLSVPPRPAPLHTFKHLTTPTSILAFSPDGQILLLASRWKRDALRLVHLPSCTVYRNWPTEKTPLGRVTSVAWSAGSGTGGDGDVVADGRLFWLAVGNEQGSVRLWEIRG